MKDWFKIWFLLELMSWAFYFKDWIDMALVGHFLAMSIVLLSSEKKTNELT